MIFFVRPYATRISRALAPLTRAAAALLVLAAFAGSAAAQNPSNAVLRGRVTDAQGAPLASAQITVLHGPTGSQARALTDAGGRYQVTGMRPGGPYTVRITRLGYANTERTGVELRLGQVLVLDFQMREAATTLAAITVEAEADTRFSTSRTGASTTIDQETIELHPLVERDFLEIADVSPMVTRTESGGISVSGQNERYNSITINGALHQDVFGAYASGVPGAEARAKAIPLAAVQEFQVQVAPYDVRSSGFTGGYLNAVSKSGTNEWEGSLFGELRDESMVGSLVVDGTDFGLTDYRKQVFGGSIGGPLLRDRVHFFFAGEVERRREPPPGYSLGVGDPLRTGISPDSAEQVAQALSALGVDAGALGSYTLSNPMVNTFSRLDWRFSDVHTLTLHHNLIRAERDVSANRAAYGAYEFSSSGYRVETSTQSLMAQLRSRISERWYNELQVSVQRTSDSHNPASDGPQIDVEVMSELGASLIQRTLRAGAPYAYQSSDLDQTVLQVNDAFSISRGDVTTTVGVGTDVFLFHQRYLPGSRGIFGFDNVDSVRVNKPTRYEVNLLQPGEDEAVDLTVAQPAFYAQNEHNFPGGLRMYYGMRIDIPLFLGTPEANADVERAFQVKTNELPSGKVLWSPRVGFNWQSQHRYITQFRGGFGMFTGRMPYVWLANAYANTGLRSILLTCLGANTPRLDVSAPSPTACRNGQGVESAAQSTRNVVAFDPAFRYPREIKASMALDQRLPWGLTASAEVLVVQTQAQVTVQDYNLDDGAPQDEGYVPGFGVRRTYGDAIAPNGYRQRQRIPGYAHVLVMGNEKTSGFAHSVTLGLEKEFGGRFTMGGSYSFNHSDDVQSLRAGDALINYGTSPAGFDPNDPSRGVSAFERPWKTILYARGSMPERFGGTQLSVIYVGQAGSSYSYVYADDMNGDGFPGVGIPLDAGNDLLFVPVTPNDLPAGIATTKFFHQLVAVEPCLTNSRGTITERNACRGPASHRLDLKVVQPIHLGRGRVELSGSLINALNLMNSEWGQVVEVAPLVPVLAQADTREKTLPGLPPIVVPTSRADQRYVGPVARDPETGELRAALPGIVQIPESQWQAQIGLQISF